MAAATAGATGERRECLRILDRATKPVESAVRVFERKRTLPVARSALVTARAARDALESAAVSRACEPARGEELIYLNHIVPGLHGWILARSRTPPTDYEIDSILRRARMHRQRGRDRLD